MSINRIDYLLGCYFHQDWYCEASSDLEVLSNFVKKESPESILSLKKELSEIVEFGKELPESFLYEHNGYYSPSEDGLTVLEWFKKLSDAL
ncbi:contact-dependent growth inhibition system immunity protein [Acinetobacter baumannii]|uniref:contact-dependent growth inhibition system immunity protein n=1 Tax=Acinetobacter baumannii TaxID=470 RepID=UPI0034CDB9C0